MNQYSSLDFHDTLLLISARTQQIMQDPTTILGHIDALTELAKHFEEHEAEWKAEWQAQRKAQSLSPLKESELLRNKNKRSN